MSSTVRGETERRNALPKRQIYLMKTNVYIYIHIKRQKHAGNVLTEDQIFLGAGDKLDLGIRQTCAISVHKRQG